MLDLLPSPNPLSHQHLCMTATEDVQKIFNNDQAMLLDVQITISTSGGLGHKDFINRRLCVN